MQKIGSNDIQISEHSINYDFLRLFAAFFIVMQALSFGIAESVPTNEETYLAFKSISLLIMLSEVGIPIFVMISGAFLLDPQKEISDKAFMKKYVLHLVLVYFAWSVFYALMEQKYFKGMMDIGAVEAWFLLDREKLIKQVILGHYHLWYIHTLFWLYILTPIFRIIIKHAKTSQLLYFTFLMLAITVYVNLNRGIFHNEIGKAFIEKANFFMPLSFLPYYLLGYVIRKISNQNFLGIALWILSGLSLYYGMIWHIKLNPMGSEANISLLSYFSPIVYIVSVTLFLFFSKFKNLYVHQYQTEIVRDLSKYTGMLYMLHPFVIEMCRKANVILPVIKWQTLLLNAIITFAISLLVAVVMGIPARLMKNFFGIKKS